MPETDIRLRAASLEEINALIAINLDQRRSIADTGQSHGMGGRNVSQAPLQTLVDEYANLVAARAWKLANPDGATNSSFQTYVADFSHLP